MLIRKYSFFVVLVMSSCIYLNHTVLSCTVHNSGYENKSVGYKNSLRWLIKLDKYCSASEMFVYNNGIPSFGELHSKHITNLSIGFSLVQKVLLWGVFILSFLFGTYWVNIWHTNNDILWSVYPLFYRNSF